MRDRLELLRVDVAAEILALETSTVRKWIAQKRIAVVRLGRAVRIPVSEVQRLVKEGWRNPV